MLEELKGTFFLTFKKYVKSYCIQSQQIPYFSIWNSKVITVISECVNHEITF